MPAADDVSFLSTGFLAGLCVGLVLLALAAALAKRSIGRLRADLDVANRRGAKEHERAEGIERERSAGRDAPSADAGTARSVLDGLERATRELASATSRPEVAAALGRAIEGSLAPSQWMVFLAADPDAKEFVVAASGCATGGRVWNPGARISSETGKVGLVVRRRATMDQRDFDAEAPMVREQVARTEPGEFRLDVIAPVRSGERVVAVLAVGGTSAVSSVARTSLDLLAQVATVVLRGIAHRDRAERFENQDTLTGVGNKSWFGASASEVVYRVRQQGGTAVLVLVGIDHYAQYARRNGHVAGDKLVRGIAQVLRPLVPKDGLLARWNADEFAILLPDADLHAAWQFAKTARTAVASIAWPFADEQPGGRVGLCAGISCFPASADSLELLIEAAALTLGEARLSCDDTNGSIVLEPHAAESIHAVVDGGPAETVAETSSADAAGVLGGAVAPSVAQRAD